VHRNPFVEFVERQRVRIVLRWRGVKHSKSAAEEASPYLAQLADIEAHEEDVLLPAGREVSIVSYFVATLSADANAKVTSCCLALLSWYHDVNSLLDVPERP